MLKNCCVEGHPIPWYYKETRWKEWDKGWTVKACWVRSPVKCRCIGFIVMLHSELDVKGVNCVGCRTPYIAIRQRRSLRGIPLPCFSTLRQWQCLQLHIVTFVLVFNVFKHIFSAIHVTWLYLCTLSTGSIPDEVVRCFFFFFFFLFRFT
jgi:hypothetical protein